nr:uncharacterized protein LOC109179345 [Ipomoea batatas]
MAWTGTSSNTRPPAPPPTTNQVPANSVNAVFDPNDSASPFYLHPSENPSLILVSRVLEGHNYHSWARAMEMSLLSKNKLGFVDGTIAVPDTILWVRTVERIWETLKARFSEADIFRVSALHAEGHQVRQGDLSVSAYFAKLKVLWDELEVVRPLPTCSCAQRFAIPQDPTDSVVSLTKDEYQLFKQLVQREVVTQGSPLDMGASPQVNLISANFVPNPLEEPEKCIFLGYPNGVKGYKLYDLKTREVFISRDVVFYEENFPYKAIHSSNSQDAHPKVILPTVTAIEDHLIPKVPPPTVLPSNDDRADTVESTETPQQEQQQLRRSSRQPSRPAYSKITVAMLLEPLLIHCLLFYPMKGCHLNLRPLP